MYYTLQQYYSWSSNALSSSCKKCPWICSCTCSTACLMVCLIKVKGLHLNPSLTYLWQLEACDVVSDLNVSPNYILQWTMILCDIGICWSLAARYLLNDGIWRHHICSVSRWNSSLLVWVIMLHPRRVFLCTWTMASSKSWK